MDQILLRPFYFTVVFWGPVYRQYFLDLLLASLLSPNNLPSLDPARGSKFLIVTTRADWDALQSELLFHQMQQYLQPVWFEMPFPQQDELKMLVMSKGHKQVAMRAFADRAYGIFVTPDLVLSDGAVAAMERLAVKGKKVVLSVAIRFAQETLLEEMQRLKYWTPGQPLVLPARDLMRLALKHLHTETLRYEFESSYFAESPISVYWRVPRGDGIIIYSFSWAPLLVDYGAIENHDASTFDNWTLDGDYIHRNFPDPENVYVVTDSDELVLVSFTKEAELHFELKPVWMKKAPMVGRRIKVDLIRALKDSLVMDELKRAIFPQPVYLHASEITPRWRSCRQTCDEVIKNAFQKEDRLSQLVRLLIRYVNKLHVVFFGGQFRSHLGAWIDCRIKQFSPRLKPILRRLGVQEQCRSAAMKLMDLLVNKRPSR